MRTALNRSDLKKVKKFLHKESDNEIINKDEIDKMDKKWMDIGVDLGLDIDVLFKIRAQYGDDPAACMREMILVWLKSLNPLPTWRNLSNSLRAEAVNEVGLADKGNR